MLDTLGTLERTHTCGELRESNVGEQVVLMGWVAKKRDFGVFTFIDLRDRDGMTQVVLSAETVAEAHSKAKAVRGMRISNFLLWQLAYSEIYVTQTLFPDFRRTQIFEAIIDYQKRDRRFGDVKSKK